MLLSVFNNIILQRKAPAQHFNAYAAFVMRHGDELDQPDFPCAGHMGAAAGAHVGSRKCDNAHPAAQFFLAAVVQNLQSIGRWK